MTDLSQLCRSVCVCLSVCVTLKTTMIDAKTTEVVEMLFEGAGLGC